MSKSLLVIETPECCLDCPCSYSYGYRVGTPTDDVCEAMNDWRLTKENMNNERPTWCPLKQMPEKKIHEPTYYAVEGLGGAFELERHKGYNACIDEILGGEEER